MRPSRTRGRDSAGVKHPKKNSYPVRWELAACATGGPLIASHRRHAACSVPRFSVGSLPRHAARQAARRLLTAVPGRLRWAVRFDQIRSASCLVLVCTRWRACSVYLSVQLRQLRSRAFTAAMLHNAPFYALAAPLFARGIGHRGSSARFARRKTRRCAKWPQRLRGSARSCARVGGRRFGYVLAARLQARVLALM